MASTSVPLDFNHPGHPPIMDHHSIHSGNSSGIDFTHLNGSFDPASIPSSSTNSGNLGNQGPTSAHQDTSILVPVVSNNHSDIAILLNILMQNQTFLQQNLIDIMKEVTCCPVYAPPVPADPVPRNSHGSTVKLCSIRLFNGKHAEVTPFLSEVKCTIEFHAVSFPENHTKVLFVGMNMKDRLPVEWFN
ncbi:hypothetical protein H0H87_012074 [Tephrocybe sp. NHM501043]|nr:hypothetical protein H0H87_012074 [Tephrocybe sp. NHM501043]